MNENRIQRTLVWGGWLRLAHWLIALSAMVLMATGWLIRFAPGVAHTASDYHDLAGIGLTLGLIIRVILLFSGVGPAHWTALVPGRSDLPKIGMTLRFYATLGKAPLPRWYAHNPLWAPIYLFVLIVLIMQTLTGLLMEAIPVVWTFYLPSVHEFWAPFILVFTLAHIVTAALHDVKGNASDISAMVNGHRIFVVEDVDTHRTPGVQSVPLEQIGKAKNTPE